MRKHIPDLNLGRLEGRAGRNVLFYPLIGEVDFLCLSNYNSAGPTQCVVLVHMCLIRAGAWTALSQAREPLQCIRYFQNRRPLLSNLQLHSVTILLEINEQVTYWITWAVFSRTLAVFFAVRLDLVYKVFLAVPDVLRVVAMHFSFKFQLGRVNFVGW